MEKASQFIQKQKEKILETVGINPKIRPDQRLETVKAKLEKLEQIVGVLRTNFVKHAKCVREMSESAFLIAQDTQQFYQKSENRAPIVEEFTDSHLSIESVSRELYHSQFHEADGILRMFDDWLDKMAICKHDLAEAEQTRKDALLLGAKVKALRDERKKVGGNSRWPQIGNKSPQNAAEAEQMIQQMSKEYERLVQKFREDRKELETTVQIIVQRRFDTFDECLFRLMECQVDFFRSGAAFTDTFSKHIEKYRQSCPRGPVRSAVNAGRRQPPPPSSPPPGPQPPSGHFENVAASHLSDEHDRDDSHDLEREHDHDHDHDDSHEHEHDHDHELHHDHDIDRGLDQDHDETADATEDHFDSEEETDEETKHEQSEPPPREQRLRSEEDLLNLGDINSYAPASGNNMNGGGSHSEFDWMDQPPEKDDLNPIHEIAPSQPNYHDPLGSIFSQPAPKSRHSIGDPRSQANGGMFGSPPHSNQKSPSTYPHERKKAPKKHADQFDPYVFEDQFHIDDFSFDPPDQRLSSGHLRNNRKNAPKSAPSPPSQRRNRSRPRKGPISAHQVAQHRKEKAEELQQQIKDKQHEAVKAMKDREQKAEDAYAEKMQKASDLQEKLDFWEYKNGVRRNIRSLLSSIHTVVWENSCWESVSLSDLTSASNVKRHYRRVLLVIHPDKSTDKDSETQAIAERLFQAMNTSWGEFQQQQKR